MLGSAFQAELHRRILRTGREIWLKVKVADNLRVYKWRTLPVYYAKKDLLTCRGKWKGHIMVNTFM